MMKFYTPKTTAIVTGHNYAVTKPTETTNAIVCNANKVNKMLSITELHETLSRTIVGNTKCKIYTDSSKYVGIGNKRKNLFSVNVLKTKYNVYISDDIVDYIPKNLHVATGANSVDKTRPNTVEITNTSDLLNCVSSVMKYFK